MTYLKTLIILAKSKKKGRYCIAGKNLADGNWVRPVKSSPFTSYELKNISNLTRELETLDILKMSFKEKSPQIHQPENEQVDMDIEWSFINKYPIDKLDKIVDGNNNDFLNIIRDINLHKDKLKKISLHNSLQLIKLTSDNEAKLFYSYDQIRDYFKPRLKFKYKGVDYSLPITDPDIGLAYEPRESKSIRNAYITIGIGEEFNQYHYILVVMFKEITGVKP
ncbi:MAG TPA: hypothetical protein VMX55_01000 [candidate division Zixibacteria bacterium]|nr:hypothetical protein [candidate division Zixibacteria bacterium]